MEIFNQSQLMQFLTQYREGLGKPVTGLRDGKNGKLLSTLIWLGHYDEYYSIQNLQTGTIDWHHGIN